MKPEITKEFLKIINEYLPRDYLTFQLYYDDAKKADPKYKQQLDKLRGHFSVNTLDTKINYRWFKGPAIDLLDKANQNGFAITMQAAVGNFGKRDTANALYPTHVVVDYEIEQGKAMPEMLFDHLDHFLSYLEKSGCPPELVIRTSPGKGHFWWPLAAINKNQWPKWTAVQDAMLRKFSCDRSCKDPSRVFRVPGFYHQKKAPFLVDIHHYEPVNAPYTLDQIISAFSLDLNPRAKQVSQLPLKTVKLTPEQQKSMAKYKDVAKETLENNIDEYSWETPDEIKDMISYLPREKSQGVLRDWQDWVQVGTAIARKFLDKQNSGLKNWRMFEAREIFLFFCKRCPHYQEGKYDPSEVWKNAVSMASAPLDINASKYTLATVVQIALDNGWIRNKFNNEVNASLVTVQEIEVQKEVTEEKIDSEGKKTTVVTTKTVKEKVAKKLQVDPALVDGIQINDYDLAEVVSLSTKDCLKYHNGIGWIQWNKKHWLEIGEDNPPYAVINLVYAKLAWQALKKMARLNKAYKGQKELPSKRKSTPPSKVEGVDYRNKKFDKKYKPLEEFVAYTKEAGKSEHKLRAVSKINKTFARSKVETEELDSEEHLFCVKNGVVNLKNGELMKHEACIDKLITKISPAEYTADAEEPTEWLKFLDSVFDGNKELIHFVKVAIGYSLTGSATERCLFLLHGRGRNGKSTFINAIRLLFGYKYSTTVSTETLTGRTATGQIPVGIAKLRGMRMASTSESDENQRLKEGTVKALTGDDIVTARFMRQNEFEFMCFAKIWFATNHLPQVRGDDDGIWDRIKVIEFKKRYYLEHETDVIEALKKTNPDEVIEFVDKELPKKLALEANQILKWAVEGAIEWYAKGLPRCKVIDEASKVYRLDQDQFSHFVDNFMEQTGVPTDRVTLTELRELCFEQTGFRYVAQKLKKLLVDRGFEFEKSSRGLVAVGVKIPIRSINEARNQRYNDNKDGDDSDQQEMPY